jgi:hypothetical protein
MEMLCPKPRNAATICQWKEGFAFADQDFCYGFGNGGSNAKTPKVNFSNEL